MEDHTESQYLLENGGKSGRKQGSDEHGTLTKESPDNSIWRELSRRQKITLLFGAASTSSIFFGIGIPTAFLSRVAVSKGGYRLYAAALLDSTYLLSSIASLVCGKYQSKIPPKTFIWSGLLAVAVSQGCFGCLEYVNNIYVFVVIGLILKSIQGIGQGFVNVALLTLLWHEIPQHVEKSYGIIRATTSAGYFFSAIASGFLYSIQNGMMIPCVVSAIPSLILSFIGWLILHDIENLEQSKDYHAWRYICNPKSMFVLGLAATCGAAFAVYGGSFTSYAQSVGVSVVDVGLMFATADVITIISNLIAGYFANVNRTCRRISMAVGFLGMIGVCLSFTSHETLPLLYVQVALFVVIASGVRTLAFPEMIYLSLGGNEELEKNFKFRSQLSGVWYFATTIPSSAFGVVGTALQNVVSYSMSQVISTLIGLVLTIVATVTIYLCRAQGCRPNSYN